MSDQDRSATDVLRQLGDELKLQAWLANAEFRHPSLEQLETREEVDALVRMRDELRVQMHLGRLEASDEFHRLEGRWQAVKHAAVRTADEAGERLHDLLREIRNGYQGLGSE